MTTIETLFAEIGMKMPVAEVDETVKKILIPFLEKEKQYRHQSKIQRLLRRSGLKPLKTLSQFDWTLNPKNSKEDFFAFARSPWIEQAANLILVGDAGLGKSHLANALCYEAILTGREARFGLQDQASPPPGIEN